MSAERLPILIVDDDAFQRRMIRIKLQTRGYEVNEAKDGIEALEFLQQQAYSVVLLDIVMPQLTGWEVLDQIRSRISIDELPVIMLTARDSAYDADAAAGRGANDYLTKPIDFRALDQRIESCTATQRSAIAQDNEPDQDANTNPEPTAEDTHRDLMPQVAEQSLAMLDSLLAGLPAIVFRAVGDGNGTVHLSYQSDGLKTFLGHSWQSVQEIIASTDNSSRHHLNRQFREKGRLLRPLYARFQVTLPSGQKGWVECRGNPHRLPSGETVWDAMMIDCTVPLSGAAKTAAEADATSADQKRYRDKEGFAHQCTRCRKVRDFGPTGGWVHVDARALQTTHTICDACSDRSQLIGID